MTPQKRLSLLVLFSLIAPLGCMPAQYRPGRDALARGDYQNAVDLLSAADRQSPNDKDITAALHEARIKGAQALFAQAASRAPEDLWKRYDDLDLARSYDPDSHAVEAALAEVAAEQQKLQLIANEAYRLLEIGKPLSGYQLFQQLAPFKPYSQELQRSSQEVESSYCERLIALGRAEVAGARLDAASGRFAAALALRPTEARARAGVKLVEGARRLSARDYKAAFDLFGEAVLLDKSDDFARGQLTSARRGVLDAFLQQGADRSPAEKPAELVSALDPYLELLELATPEDPQRAVALLKAQELRKRLAARFLAAADEARDAGADRYPQTILMNLRAAHLLDPEGAQAHEPEAARALSAATRRQALAVGLRIKDESGRGNGFDSALQEGLANGLRGAALPGLTLAPGPSESPELVVAASVVKNEVTDEGRATPIQRTSRYVSGTRTVKNAAYERLEREAEARRRDLEQAEVGYGQRAQERDRAEAQRLRQETERRRLEAQQESMLQARERQEEANLQSAAERARQEVERSRAQAERERRAEERQRQELDSDRERLRRQRQAADEQRGRVESDKRKLEREKSELESARGADRQRKQEHYARHLHEHERLRAQLQNELAQVESHGQEVARRQADYQRDHERREGLLREQAAKEERLRRAFGEVEHLRQANARARGERQRGYDQAAQASRPLPPVLRDELEAAHARLSSAQQQLASTAEFVSEDVISDYQYEEYQVRVAARLRASYRLINAGASPPEAEQQLSEEEEQRGVARRNVQATDQNGVKPLDGPLPEPEAQRQSAQAALMRKFVTQVVKEVQTFQHDRFARAADAAKAAGREREAIEAALLYLETAPEGSTAERLEELAHERALLSRGNRRLSRYRAPAARADPWPAAALDR